MSKTNFTKVEEALTEGLRRIQLDKLLVEADEARAKGNATTPAEEKGPPSQELEARRHKAQILRVNLKWLNTKDPDLYGKLGVKKEDVNKFLARVDVFNEKECEIFRVLLERTEKVKADFAARDGVNKGDDDLIAQQRKKHITKRFNVQDKWLPLK